MKKRIITAAVFAACLALCAAVWPQNEPAVETPAAPILAAATATKPEVPEISEIEEITISEEDKAETAEPTPIHVTPVEETIDDPEQESGPAPTSPDTPSDNLVYVEGFGWLESQGSNHVEYAEDMYENGNKIGSMG